MKQHGRQGWGGRTPGTSCDMAHRHPCRAVSGLPPPRRVLILSPAPHRDASPRAAMQAAEPLTPALPLPFLLWGKPWGGSLGAPELVWKCWCGLKQKRNGGCSAAHTVVFGDASLLSYKNLHRCQLCSPKWVADGQKDPFLKGLPLRRSQGKRTQAQRAQCKSLGSFNTSAFDPKCALLGVNSRDQHVLCLLIWFLLDLQTSQSPWACSRVAHAAFGTPQAHQFSVTQILTLEWCFAPGYCPQTIICRKTNKRRTLEILLYDTFLIPENVR